MTRGRTFRTPLRATAWPEDAADDLPNAAARLDTPQNPSNAQDRDRLAAKMTPAQLAEAQRRAAAWQAAPEPSPCLEAWKRAVQQRPSN